MKAGDGEEGGRVIELNKLGPLSSLQYREGWREKDSGKQSINHCYISYNSKNADVYSHLIG